MKNKLLFLTLILGLMFQAEAQRLPLNNQYLVNPFSLSPSYAGSDELTNIFAGYRNQWGDIKGAPITKLFYLNSPIGSKIGVGGSIISDQEGYFNRLYASLSYAYHLTVASEHKVSFGLTGTVFEYRINLTDANIENPFDPVILNRESQNETTLNAGASLLYRFNGLNVGFAAPILVENKSTYNKDHNIDEFLIKRHFFGHASYTYDINDKFTLMPFVITRMTPEAPFNYEFALLAKYNKMSWLGLSMRREGSMGAHAGLALNDQVVLNYTYEFMGKMTGNTTGTHEFAIGLYFGKGLKDIKEQQKLLKKTSDSLVAANKTLKDSLDKMSETLKKEKGKLNAKIDILQDRLNEVEIELGNLSTQGITGEDGRKKALDDELLDIERKLKAVGGQFFVVVEAFKNPDNAKRAVTLWKDRGLEVQMIYNDIREFYYIYVNKYGTYIEAQAVKKKLADNNIFSWIYLWAQPKK